MYTVQVSIFCSMCYSISNYQITLAMIAFRIRRYRQFFGQTGRTASSKSTSVSVASSKSLVSVIRYWKWLNFFTILLSYRLVHFTRFYRVRCNVHVEYVFLSLLQLLKHFCRFRSLWATITFILWLSEPRAALFMLDIQSTILSISFTLIFVRIGSDNSSKSFTYNQDPKHLKFLTLRGNWKSKLRKREQSAIVQNGLPNDSEPIEIRIDRNIERDHDIEVDSEGRTLCSKDTEISSTGTEDMKSFREDDV